MQCGDYLIQPSDPSMSHTMDRLEGQDLHVLSSLHQSVLARGLLKDVDVSLVCKEYSVKGMADHGRSE